MNSSSSDESQSPPLMDGAWAAAALQVAGIGSWLLLPEQEVLHLDEGMQQLFRLGKGSAQLPLEDWLQHVGEPDRGRLAFEIAMALRGEQDIDRRLRLLNSDEQDRPQHVQFRTKQIRLESGACGLLGVCRDCADLVRLEQEASALSMIDPVSGLVSRRYFEQEIEREWRIAMRERSELCLVLVKIDLFRRFRERAGDEAANRIVSDLGAALQAVLARPADRAGRFEDDCMAMLLPRTDLAGALHVSGRLHQRFSAQLAKLGGEAGRDLGLSIGASHLGEAATALGSDVLLARAMAACHCAQRQGGDQIEGWQEDMPEAPHRD